MSERLGLGALSDALGEGYGYEHDEIKGVLYVRRDGVLICEISDQLTLDDAVALVRNAEKGE